MPSQHLKDFKRVWTNACHTMWVEIIAIRGLEGHLKGNYMSIPNNDDLSTIVYAPECKGRMEGITKDTFLDNIDTYIRYNITTLRVVLLSAAFETYFLAFLDEYLEHRSKYYVNGGRTSDGDKVFGEVRKTRGLSNRVEVFAEQTGAKIAGIQPHLPILKEAYCLRNIIAHKAGICDAYTASNLSIVQCGVGKRVSLEPEVLISKLAPPCITIAEQLDRKIVPES